MTEIFGKISRVLIDVHQSFARSPFRVNHVVEFQLNMEELQCLEFAGVIKRDRRVID